MFWGGHHQVFLCTSRKDSRLLSCSIICPDIKEQNKHCSVQVRNKIILHSECCPVTSLRNLFSPCSCLVVSPRYAWIPTTELVSSSVLDTRCQDKCNKENLEFYFWGVQFCNQNYWSFLFVMVDVMYNEQTWPDFPPIMTEAVTVGILKWLGFFFFIKTIALWVMAIGKFLMRRGETITLP